MSPVDQTGECQTRGSDHYHDVVVPLSALVVHTRDAMDAAQGAADEMHSSAGFGRPTLVPDRQSTHWLLALIST